MRPSPRFLTRFLPPLLCLQLIGLAFSQGGYPETIEVPPVHAATTAYDLTLVVDELWIPVALTPVDDGSGRLLIVSLEGQVWLLDGPELAPTPFLDLAGRVTAREGEQGLFSVALEPRESRGRPRRLVAAYTEHPTGDLVVAAFPLAHDLSGADAAKESVILRVALPEPFHHGGQVAFGPDGMLYLSVGSGEVSPELLHVRPAPAHDLTRLLGKVLRLDLSEEPYRVPADNPFTQQSDPAAAAAGARPEVWARGFRNPWKFTFGPGGELYLADVGEARWEEVNLVERGADHGWPAREGPECLRFLDAPGLVEPECEALTFADPLVAYAHVNLDPQGGQSITGGVLVTDPGLPELAGHYLYGDFVTGRLWSYDPATGRVELLLETDLRLSEVSAGAGGEVLLLSIDGRLMRLVHAP